jgi:hypothetical protein
MIENICSDFMTHEVHMGAQMASQRSEVLADLARFGASV